MAWGRNHVRLVTPPYTIPAHNIETITMGTFSQSTKRSSTPDSSQNSDCYQDADSVTCASRETGRVNYVCTPRSNGSNNSPRGGKETTENKVPGISVLPPRSPCRSMNANNPIALSGGGGLTTEKQDDCVYLLTPNTGTNNSTAYTLDAKTPSVGTNGHLLRPMAGSDRRQGSNQKAPNRHQAKKLTCVPESERPINYRLEVALVGQGARVFAEAAVNSERAVTYRPKRLPSEQSAVPGPFASDTYQSGLAEQFILFCPMGGPHEKELARVRFWTIELFSQSLPLSRDPATSANIIVVLLFWCVTPEDACGTIQDFTARLAEIQYLPRHLRPYTTLLAFAANPEQEMQLINFKDRWRGAVNIEFNQYHESEEDEVMEAVQDICDGFVNRQKFSFAASLNRVSHNSMQSVRSVATRNTRCCTIA